MESIKKTTEQNRRKIDRQLIQIKAEITEPMIGKVVVFTQDVSDSGAFVVLPRDRCPPVGSSLNIRLYRKPGAEGEAMLSARVVRVTESGMGLQFFDFDMK